MQLLAQLSHYLKETASLTIFCTVDNTTKGNGVCTHRKVYVVWAGVFEAMSLVCEC